MLARIEIAVGIFVVALLCIIAGYAIVSALLAVKPGSAVQTCVEQSYAVAAQTHQTVSRFQLTRNCENLLSRHGL